MNLTSDSIAQTATRLPLPSGETHADITGPPTGPTLIMVPGATLPMAVWLPLSEPLNLRGIRTVRYDLPGRGHTPLDHRQGSFEEHLTQLHELILSVANGAPLHLAGLASGALVVAEYANRFPGTIASCTLVAPDGAETTFTVRERLLSNRLIGPVLFRLIGKKSLLKRVPRYSDRVDIQTQVRCLLEFSLQAPGFSTFPLHNGEQVYTRFAKSETATLVAWGDNDHITPPHAVPLMRSLFGETSVSVFRGSGHLPFFDNPEQASELVASLITSSQPRTSPTPAGH